MPRVKFSNEKIAEVAYWYDLGYGQNRIADETGISLDHVIAILKGKCRASVTGGRIRNGFREQYRSEAAKHGWEKRRQRLNGKS